MKISRLSIYRYSLIIAIYVLLFTLFGKLVFAEERPGAGNDIPMTDNIIHDNDGIVAGSLKSRSSSQYADRTSVDYYYNGFNLFWYHIGSSIKLYGKTQTINCDYINYMDDGSERQGTTTKQGTSSVINGITVYKYEDKSNYPNGFSIFDTNIPIFESEADIEVYVDTGNFDNAVNKDDVLPKEEVPAPIDIDMAESSKGEFGSLFTSPIVISWRSGSNDTFTYSNMRYNISYEIVYGYTHMVAGVSTDGTEDTGKIQVATNVKYNNETSSYTIGVNDLNDSITRSILGLNIAIKTNWIESVTVWLQNVDNSDYTNVSNEKYVQYNFKSKTESSDSPPEDDGSIGGGESENGSSGQGTSTGNNGNIKVDASIKNDYPKYNIWNGLNGALSGSGEVKNALNNAWGLFGTLSENGLIAILGECMPFVPQEIWNLFTLAITSGISFLICGALFRFLRG